MSSARHLPIAPMQRFGGGQGQSLRARRDLPLIAERSPDRLWEEAGGTGNTESASAEEDSEKLFQVGDLAKAAGKTVRAIHHYEEIGLLKPHARSKGRYRLYDQAALTRIRWISKLHDLGMSLAEIQQMLSAWEKASSAPEAMSQIRGHYLQKLRETRAQIDRLAALERELIASIDYLDTCDTCDPAELVRACTCCNVHDKNQHEPELIAGIHSGNAKTKDGESRE